MDMSDCYYIDSIMQIIDEAELDLSPDEYHALIEETIQNLKEKIEL